MESQGKVYNVALTPITAADYSRRFYPEPRAYYNRKMQNTISVVPHSALAHKLARAGYYVMRDRVPFRPEKLFG